MRRILHVPLLLVALTPWLACRSSRSAEPPAGSAAVRAADSGAPDELALGGRLYGAHCAVCHGDRGEGDGPAAAWLFPAARDFTRARFRLVSTENGVPTRDDLVTTLRRGIPGSAMPAWSWLADDELDALAGFVRHLATLGVARDLHFSGAEQDEALADAAISLTPGRRLPSVAAAAPDAAVLERGDRLYGTYCASCHGPDGRGGPPRYDDDGSLNWPRDFTAGYLKGGRDAEALGWRIQAGLPGTAMPGTRLAAGDLEALVAWLHERIPEEAAASRVQRRATLRAPRVEAVPASAEAAEWSACQEIEVVLAPLDSAPPGPGVTGARLAAVHDGRQVALRVRWYDAGADVRYLTDLTEPDACALQLSADERPSFFGMGDAAHTTNLWHWKALREADLEGALDLLDPPHASVETFEGEVRADVPVYHPRWTLPDVAEGAESLRGGGVGTLAAAPDDAPVAAWPTRSEGAWSVVFTRACEPSGGGEVALRPGAAVNLAVAIWDGSAGDRGARKSISIWQRLELGR